MWGPLVALFMTRQNERDPHPTKEWPRECEIEITGGVQKWTDTCRPQKQNSSLSGLLHQATLMMQAAKHRGLHNTVTGGSLCGRWPEHCPGWAPEFQDLMKSGAGLPKLRLYDL